MNIKDMLNEYHAIEFTYQGVRHYFGRCNKRRNQELYYFKAENEDETRMFHCQQDLLDTMIRGKRFKDILDDIEIVEVY